MSKGDSTILEALRTGQYWASDSGQIYSRKRGSDKALARAALTTGYEIVSLSINGKKCTVYAHRFVAIAKLGLPPADKSEVNHKNGKKGDNNPSNLEWVSPSENSQHTYDTGIRRRKVDDPSLMEEVRKSLARGESRRSIAIRIGVNKNTVNNIALRISHH